MLITAFGALLQIVTWSFALVGALALHRRLASRASAIISRTLIALVILEIVRTQIIVVAPSLTEDVEAFFSHPAFAIPNGWLQPLLGLVAAVAFCSTARSLNGAQPGAQAERPRSARSSS